MSLAPFEKLREEAINFEWKNRNNEIGNVSIRHINYNSFKQKPNFGVAHSSGPGNSEAYTKANLNKFISLLLKAQKVADRLNK